MAQSQTQIFILDEPSLARKALESQLKLAARGTFKTRSFDSIQSIEGNLDESVKAIFLDLFRFPQKQILRFVGGVRNAYPWIAFVLWVDDEEYTQQKPQLPVEWRRRLDHYKRLAKNYDRHLSNEVAATIESVNEYFNKAIQNPKFSVLLDDPEALLSEDSRLLSSGSNRSAGSIPFEKRAFISYSRLDQEFVEWLWQQLNGHRIGTWLDRKDIRPGEVWDDKINEALQKCAAMLYVLSPDSVASNNVAKEWKYFMSAMRRPIIPLLWKPCTPHFQLVHLQHIDFQDYRAGAVDELVGVLRTHGL